MKNNRWIAAAALFLCVTLTACNGGETAATTVSTDAKTTESVTATAGDETEQSGTTQSGVSSSSGASVTTGGSGKTTVSVTSVTGKTTTPTTPTTAPDKREEAAALPAVLDRYPSFYNGQAQTERARIHALKDTVKAASGGTTYYISPKGDNNNPGTKEKPWKTQAALSSHTVKAGDAVLFERGGTYRSTAAASLVSGVSYGAYGKGDKPILCGSPMNSANCTWTEVQKGIWTPSQFLVSDVGLIVFGNGEHVGRRCNSQAELSKPYDFYQDKPRRRVLVKLDRDPSKVFSHIEIGLDNAIVSFDNKENITIENLAMRYTGGHAVKGNNVKNITVRGCEIAYIGGSILYGYGDGTTRYGNAIQINGNVTNAVMEDNWIYEVYDSGITFQGLKVTVNGYDVRRNLIEYCGMGSFEYWGTTVQEAKITDNLMRFAGYGFGGEQRPDKHSRAHIQSNGKADEGKVYNPIQGTFVIQNNIFDQSAYQLINIISRQEQLPHFSNNVYVQKKGGVLGYYKVTTDIPFSDNVLDVIKSTVGDTSATVRFA